MIINKTPLRNGNCPISEPITKIGVAHTMGQHLVTAYLQLNYSLIQGMIYLNGLIFLDLGFYGKFLVAFRSSRGK